LIFGLLIEMAVFVPELHDSWKHERRLRKDASTALEGAAAADARAKQVESTNLVLRTELAKLEAAVQWRTITAEQEATIIGILKPLATANPMVNKTVLISAHDGTDFEADAVTQKGVLPKSRPERAPVDS